MKTAGFAILVFVASFAACWVCASFVTILIGGLAGVSQAEGAYAMGAVFIIGPVAGLVAAIVITALAVVRRKHKLSA